MSTIIVDTYIAQQPENQQILLDQLRMLIKTSWPAFEENVKWGKPNYSAPKPVCYLSAQKGYVNLGFFEGGLLQDPEKLLEGTGAKMRHIKVRTVADIQEKPFRELILKAVASQKK